MLKLAIAIIGLPFFVIGCLDAAAFVMSWIDRIDHKPLYAHWVAAILWLGFVTSTRVKIGDALERVRAWYRDASDRISRRGKYHPERWWYERYPGSMMLSSGRLHPIIKSHYDEWKAEMMTKGFGPGKKDLARLRG